MRAAVSDRRLEAIAGPLHHVWSGTPREIVAPTDNVPLTVAVVATLTGTSGGSYVLNSPTTADGRRAYVWVSGALDGPPVNWTTGMPSVVAGSALVSQRQVVFGTLGTGIPQDTRILGAPINVEGERGTVHQVIIWPRLLTPHETEQATVWLKTNMA